MQDDGDNAEPAKEVDARHTLFGWRYDHGFRCGRDAGHLVGCAFRGFTSFETVAS